MRRRNEFVVAYLTYIVHFYDVTMRAVISGVNVVDGLLRLRVCLLTVLVVLCAVDRSSSRGDNKKLPDLTLRI